MRSVRSIVQNRAWHRAELRYPNPNRRQQHLPGLQLHSMVARGSSEPFVSKEFRENDDDDDSIQNRQHIHSLPRCCDVTQQQQRFLRPQRFGFPIPQQQPNYLYQTRMFHTTQHQDRTAVTVILALGAISATSYAASSAIRAWKDYKSSLPTEPAKAEEATAAKEEFRSDDDTKQQQERPPKTEASAGGEEGKRENVFFKWFGVGVGAKYYEGGFEEPMTRREAALILGVRESSSATRIKEAHRKLLVLNHPDTGGSTYIAGKINEAKELLLKGTKF